MDIKNICTTYVVHPDCRTRFLDDIQTHKIEKSDIVHGGIANLRTAFEIDRPEPYFHCVIFTVKGTGVFWDEQGKRLPLKAGSVVFAPAGVPQRYKMTGKTWKILFFFLHDTAIWKPLQDRKITVRKSESIGELEIAMEGYVAESERNEHDSALATSMFAELIEIFLRRDLNLEEDPKALRYRHELYRLWEKVGEDLSRDWSVGDLANEMHMSTACFYRVCAQYANLKPMAKVISLRMRKAEELLSFTDRSIKSIAEMVGYGSGFSLSEAFRRYSGLSPTEFRRRNPKGQNTR